MTLLLSNADSYFERGLFLNREDRKPAAPPANDDTQRNTCRLRKHVEKKYVNMSNNPAGVFISRSPCNISWLVLQNFFFFLVRNTLNAFASDKTAFIIVLLFSLDKIELKYMCIQMIHILVCWSPTPGHEKEKSECKDQFAGVSSYGSSIKKLKPLIHEYYKIIMNKL